jgi:formate/nitrite transporter FocA (FNT family)
MPDAVEKNSEEQTPKKSSGQIFDQEVDEGLGALHLPVHRLFISAFGAGLELGLSLLFISIIQTLGEDGALGKPVLELLTAAATSFGFIVVVLGRSELFTEQTTLAILPLLSGKSTPREVGRLWTVVYVGNMLGAAACAYLIVVIGVANRDVTVDTFHRVATNIVDHPSWVILLSGVIAGWLMGLVSWLVAASRDTISQIILIGIFTSAIGFAHLHHSILGTTEVLGGVFSNSGTTLRDFGKFLLWATIGNAIGGAGFVALLKFGHARPEQSA